MTVINNKNLMLGNGINIEFGIKDLRTDNIATRFRNILINSSPLYDYLCHVAFTPELCNSLFTKAPDQGIETLAAEVYQYIYAQINQISDNDEYRLLNAIKTSAINAIFYDNAHFIKVPELDAKKINCLNSYTNVYTLNYAEFWEPQNSCSYLHGEFIPLSIPHDTRPILLYASEEYNLPEYVKEVKKLSLSYNTVEFNGYDIVFSPLLDKQEVIGVGHDPSETLFPAGYLFPFDPPELYTQLDGVSSLDIFGMPPYGDEKLIERIAQIPDLTVYVYKMDQRQVSEWNNNVSMDYICGCGNVPNKFPIEKVLRGMCI